MNCKICNSSKFELAYAQVADLEYQTAAPVDFVRCLGCGLLSQEPLPEISAMTSFYPENYRNYLPVEGGGFFAFLKKKKFQEQMKKLAKYISPNSKILEIGYGNGELLNAFKEAGFNKLYGCDFSAKNYEHLTALDINIRIANVEESIPFEDSFDVIILNNVIEHFLDPLAVLRNCYSKLNPGGKILMFTPNSDAFELEIFGKYWAGFHAPRHIHLFNLKNIQILASALGFKQIQNFDEVDPGQWAISLQNFYQSLAITKIPLRNGLAPYTTFLAILFLPFSYMQNLLKRPTSLFVLLLK